MNRKTTTREHAQRLQRLREGGHLRYVLLHGVLGWGVPTGVLFALAMSWLREKAFLDVLLLALVAFGAGGVLFGEVMWRRLCASGSRSSPRRKAHAGHE